MPAIKENVSLRDGPNGAKIGKVAHAGDSVAVVETKDGSSHIKLANGDEGWVASNFVDEGAAEPEATPIDKQKFANSCIIQALINAVNPHFLVGVAQLRSGITGGKDGDRIGPYRLTVEEWKTIVPPFTENDINSTNQQIAGFAFMVSQKMAALGDGATPVQLYCALFPDADPATIGDKLRIAFDATADIEAKAEADVLDPPADPNADPPTSGSQFNNVPSNLPISPRAYNLIISYEVSSEAVYNKRYQHPEWPGGKSGVTIGIGYDVGYCSSDELNTDWNSQIDTSMIEKLQSVRGLKGQDARAALAGVQTVVVPWEAATNVHAKTVIPRWVGIVTRALQNTGQLSPHSLGALVSLAYNRGPSFSAVGDRYIEMNGIRQAMAARNFGAIPGLIRDMKRLWPSVRGLQIRRDSEAKLFQDGLAGGGTGTPVQGNV
jgi:hypothetical protein